MEQVNKANYQTYILFFSWTSSLIAAMARPYIRLELAQIVLPIVLIDIALNLRRQNPKLNRVSYHFISLLFILYGWLIFSMAYSPSLSYKYDKTFFFVANIVYFLYPFFIKKINFELLIRLYCIIILPLSAYYDYMLSIVWKVKSNETALFMNIRDAYLIVGGHLGILFLLLLFYNKNIYLKIITLILLIATSARAPLLFVILIFLFYFISNLKIQPVKPKTIIRTSVVAFSLFIVAIYKADAINNLFSNAYKRFGSLAGGADGSALERINRLKFAFYHPFEKVTTFFFGNGIGSFGLLYEKVDKRSYPHNVLLESFFELGMIGLVLFLIIFINVFRKISFKENAFGLLFIFLFLNAMKSSNITDLWILFSIMGGIVSSYALREKQ